MDVFLSYNREDQQQAQVVVRGLEALGLTVWWDADLRAGQAYDEVTENALRTAAAVVVMWSQRAVASRWVRAEATLAQRLGTLVPCMIEMCERPIMFELVQTADLTHWTGDQNDRAWLDFAAHVRAVIAARHPPAGPDAARPAAPERPRAAPKPSNERREVTFLSGEIADGHRAAMALDPEDWHELLVSLAGALDAVVSRFGSSIKWDGHRFACSFGYPVAQEDAARRSVQAALELRARLRAMALRPTDWPGGPLELKIGVHAGDVLVTRNDRGEVELFGEGSAVASRLRDRAEPGGVLVSESVRQLASRSFVLQPVPGDDGREQAYAVQSAHSHSGNRSFGATTRFVGREDDLHLIASRWRKVLAGNSQLVLVRGEAGIGKSRLIDEFRSGLEPAGHFWLMLQGSSMFPNTPYHAIGQLLQGLDEDGAGESDRALAMLADAARPLVDVPETGGGDLRRRQLHGAFANALFALAQERPLVLMIDDLHWIDPSTLEIVEMLVEQADQDSLLFVATARPEFVAPWPEHEHHCRLTLGRLPQDDVRKMVEHVLADAMLPGNAMTLLVDRADGVPLFAEELARMVANGSSDGSTMTLPSTLRALLAARMDRLAAARQVLQMGAVLGRSFPFDLLQHMTGLATSELAPMLEQLTDEHLLLVRGSIPAAQYRFKHALLQDAAYETLPRKQQRELHRLAATTLVTNFPDLAASQREVVANHWTRAGATAEAVAAWIAAGDAATHRAAAKEAEADFRKGLALIGGLPEGPERDEIAFDLWSKLNRALQETHGYADPRTAEAGMRAAELAARSGKLGRVLLQEAQLWRTAITAGDYHKADVIRENVLARAALMPPEDVPPWMAIFATNARLQTSFYAGRIHDFEAEWQAWHTLVSNGTTGHAPADMVIATGVGALGAWMAGRSDLARDRMLSALDLAQQTKQPYAIVVAHHFAGTLYNLEEDAAATHDHSRKAIALCAANGYDYILHLVQAKLGWGLPPEAITPEDIAKMRQSIDEMIASEAKIGSSININNLAATLERSGRTEEAMAAVEWAFATNPQERVGLPQTFEIKSRLLAASGDRAAAIACLREGLALAVELGTLAPELALAGQLAETLIAQNDGAKGNAAAWAAARAVLTETLARCGPDTHTPALGRARARLASLS